MDDLILLEKTTRDIYALGKTAVTLQIESVRELANRIDNGFETACKIILRNTGHVIMLGLGKSGHVARKIAATLASTGTPAFYIHAGEASHGDMGMITEKDVVWLVSYSGETSEILTLLPLLKRLQIPLIAMTGYPHSQIGQSADAVLNIHIQQEACSLGLAPSTSTTAALILGDALALTLAQIRGFTAVQFARNHPGGTLGQRLLLQLSDIMHTGDAIPKVAPSCMLDEALFEITRKSFGMTTVVSEKAELIGVFTDGDLRRTLDEGHNIHVTKISTVMTSDPITASQDLLATDALHIMREHKITSLIVVDCNNKPIGLVHWHDLLRKGIIE